MNYTRASRQRLFLAIGGDGNARRIVNALARKYPGMSLTAEFLREQVYDLPYVRGIGAASMERLNAFIEREGKK